MASTTGLQSVVTSSRTSAKTKLVLTNHFGNSPARDARVVLMATKAALDRMR